MLPLLVFPFTLSVVGAELYAQVVLSEALSIVLLTIVIYGFEVDGVARVVQLVQRNDFERLSEVFSSIFCIRMLLFLVGAPLIALAALLLDEQLLLLTLFWLLVPLSYALQPAWLFQGLERNAALALWTVLSRVLAVIAVMLLVERSDDYRLVPLVIGGFYLAGAICSLIYAVRKFELRFVAVPAGSLKQMLWSGKEIFFGNLSVMLYRDVNVIALGVFGVSGSGVAAYSLAEKIVKGIQASMRPLNQLFFPVALRLAQKTAVPAPEIFAQLLKVTLPQLGAVAFLLIGLAATYWIFLSDFDWLRKFENADHVARLASLMSFATFFGIANFMFGVAGLNALGQRRYFFAAIILTGVVSIIACAALIVMFREFGAAVGFVLAEVLLFALVVKRYFSNRGSS